MISLIIVRTGGYDFSLPDRKHEFLIEILLSRRCASFLRKQIIEISYSSVKRSLGSAVRARAWYRQFREIALAAAVYNVEQAIKQ